jgi:hypothetical protein
MVGSVHVSWQRPSYAFVTSAKHCRPAVQTSIVYKKMSIKSTF